LVLAGKLSTFVDFCPIRKGGKAEDGESSSPGTGVYLKSD
jgi:hypothetical protein